jgi:hypothetical protein
MKKTPLKFLLLGCCVFQVASAYQMADISFVLADKALLEEIGVITPVDKILVTEETSLQEEDELLLGVEEQDKEVPNK